MLLALLLLALIALLTARADLRVPAAHWTRSTLSILVFDVAGLSPRTAYEWRLDLAGLGHSPLAQRWRAAVDTAPVQALPRHRRVTLDFPADTITAEVFIQPLRRGEALAWRLSRSTRGTGRLYATLEYQAARDTAWRNVQRLVADDRTHRLTVAADGRYRLVFQPELFAPIHATLSVAYGGSLPMPVVGAHRYDIGGGFGVARDGGKRTHEGIDIFARRNTPVQAVIDGRVSTGNGGLGGHYIFLSSGLTGPRYYYAHLDHFTVADGTRVKAGDTIGTVGNSGNAAGGPTHLHFGIYTAGGAIDPAPFVMPLPDLP